MQTIRLYENIALVVADGQGAGQPLWYRLGSGRRTREFARVLDRADVDPGRAKPNSIRMSFVAGRSKPAVITSVGGCRQIAGAKGRGGRPPDPPP
jgi:hypothetical protein